MMYFLIYLCKIAKDLVQVTWPFCSEECALVTTFPSDALGSTDSALL